MSTIIQNTEEWIKWRAEGIGASESPIIMGDSPYKTIHELYEQKINPTDPKYSGPPDYIQQKGHDFEAAMRPKLEAEKFMSFPPVTMELESNKRIRCSLDGYNEEEKINWECKLVGKDIYHEFKEFEVIPEKYYAQLMHQCLVSGATKFILTCGTDVNNYCHHEYDLTLEDTEYIKNRLVPNILRFIKCVDNKVPPELSPNDTVQSKDPELKKMITQYKRAYKSFKKYEAQVDSLKEEIFKKAGEIHNRVNISDVSIVVTKSEDTVVPDPERYCEEFKVDLSALGFTKIKNGRVTKRINLPKAKE